MKSVVLLKTKWGVAGGLEKYANRIADAFIKTGAKLTVLSTSAPKTIEPLPYTLKTLNTISWPGFIKLEQFNRSIEAYLNKNPADLVFGMDRSRRQTHMRAGNGVHAAYLKTRSPFCKLNPLHRTILSIEKDSFESPYLQKVFTNSYMVRNEILQFYKTDPQKIVVVHNGVEWKEMELDFGDNQRPSSPYHFLFIGNGFSRKGLSPLLLALSKLQNRDFTLTVIGKDKNSIAFQKLARKLGLEEKVRFIGPTEKVREYYKKADCLVIPSFYDPFANVTVEALAMGLFVVSSKTNGGHEVITKDNGLIIEDLYNLDSIVHSLNIAMNHLKTTQSALAIRNSVKHLDFSHQLNKIMDHCG